MPKFREITGQFVGYIPDGIDSDIVPDRAPMNGRVTFTPVFTGGVIAFPELMPPEFAHPRTIHARIVDGFVQVEVNEGEGDDEQIVLQPLTLMVTVDDEASQVWSWRAEFSEILIGASDEYVTIPSWSFRVPDGTGPVDLTELVPLKSTGTVDVTKGPRGAGLENITAVDGQLVFAYTDGEETTVPIPEAVQGPQGEPGPAGADGEQGPEGPQGPAGEIPDLLVGNITDATPTGKNLMLAATEGAARNALGLQTGATTIAGAYSELKPGSTQTNSRVWSPKNISDYVEERSRAAAEAAKTEVNVKDLGAVGDGATDDTDAIQEALTNHDSVYIPPGVYRTSTELKIPSNTTLRGAGRYISVIKLDDGVDRTLCVLTNAGNNREQRETPDTNIEISDLGFYGAGDTRVGSASFWPEVSGSTVALSCVENVSLSRCHFSGGHLHCLDIAASNYCLDSGNGGGIFYEAPGPSRFVSVRDCSADWAWQDDAFTTHDSGDILFDNCHAVRIASPFGGPSEPPAITENSQGFEVDDGSFRVTVRNCYARGYIKGFQVKGHDDHPPARDAYLLACVAENCAMSFDIDHADPQSFAHRHRPARNVTLDGCISINPTPVHPTAFLTRRAMNIYAYDGVFIKNMTLVGGEGNRIKIGESVENLVIDGLIIHETGTVNDAGQGLIHIYNSAGQSLTIKNVSVSTPIKGSLITSSKWQGSVTVENIRSYTEDVSPSPAVSFANNSDRSHTARNVFGIGHSADISVGTGDDVGTYVRDFGVDTQTRLGAGTLRADIKIGEGVPSHSARVGSLYLRTDGGSGSTLYVRESSGWVAK